jgi:hypothetical protein
MSEYHMGIIKTIPPPYAFHKAIRDLLAIRTNNENKKYMTKEELITKQQLKIEKQKKKLKEYKAIAKSIRGKFYNIGEPLNDNRLQFNKEQQGWLFEVVALLNQIL